MPRRHRVQIAREKRHEPTIGHTKLESTVRYLGVELDDALELSEALEI